MLSEVVVTMREYTVRKALNDLHNKSLEDLTEHATQEVKRKLSQENDLLIPENVDKDKAMIDERVAEWLDRFLK